MMLLALVQQQGVRAHGGIAKEGDATRALWHLPILRRDTTPQAKPVRGMSLVWHGKATHNR